MTLSGRGLGTSASSGFNSAPADGGAWAQNRLINPLSAKGGPIRGVGRGLGNNATAGFNSAAGVSDATFNAKFVDPLSRNSYKLYNQGNSLGSQILRGLAAGLAGAKANLSGTIRGTLDLLGFAGGGYTGAGGKYQVAGVVHRGEYVVPKHGVDQSSGLPKAGYMASISRSTPAPVSRGYAGGGSVGGSTGMVGVVIDPRQFRQLAAAQGPGVAVLANTPAQLSSQTDGGRTSRARRGSQR
jgi:hypothetical protein